MKSILIKGIAGRSLRLIPRITVLLVLFNTLAAASTFEERAEFIIDDLASNPVPGPGGSGKLPYGYAIAHLATTNGQDAAAQEFVAGSSYAGEIFFNSIMQVRALYMAGDHMSQAQLDSVEAIATDPGNNWANMGTENHRKMTWSSGYLLAQYFPDAQWRWNAETISSQELMSRVQARLVSVGQNEYDAGYSEFLSPNYEIYHVAAMINLYDYATDPEMKAIAEAFLLYHFSVMALGSFEEVALPPWSRKAGDMDLNITGASVQWLLWLFWGHGNVAPDRDVNPELPIVFFAISDWRPPQILDDISHRVVDFPYTARMQQTHWQWNPTRYVMRTTYQDQLYAVSSGAIRHIPSAFQLDDSQFMIAWAGGAPIRQITAFHPYWRSASSTENDDWTAPTSPFMQTGHYEDSAIMLFDIPAEDPWAGVGQWASERAGPINPLAQARFPSFMTYVAGADNWVFLSDGPVYIGIKVLKDGWLRDRRSVSGFNVLKSRGTEGERWQSGFIFEVGTEAEFGSFEAFQQALAANPVSVDWETMTASYTNSSGDILELVYNSSVASEDIPNHTVPQFSVNGTAVNFDESWPVLESPWTSLVDGVLQIDIGPETRLVADWSESVPVIGERSTSDTPPVIVTPPSSITVTEGDTATFTVAAEGSEPLTYKWYKDDILIAVADESTLVLAGTVVGDSGSYTVEVGNPFGSVTSDPAVLEVEPFVPPTSWAGFPILQSGDVDTGAFLGTLRPFGDWVYLYSIDQYIYLPEADVSGNGAWIFLYK